MNKINSKTVYSLDGHDDQKDIAEHLAGNYHAIFSSARTDDAVLDKLKQTIDDRVLSEHHHSYTITVENAINAIRNLNTDKSDGIRGTCSNHFIYASHHFYVVLSVLINAMIVHGYSANELLQSVLMSIPKDARGDLLASDNYRGIALCSVIDYIILERHSDDLKTAHLQFAYKKEHSTTMCTAMIKEVVAHYTSNGSFVYGCLLDATKAFDCVNYGKLFSLLCDRNLPGVVIRFLLDSYSRQNVFTRWSNVLSNAIHMENGVKQGGVLSPFLFCVYFDELLKCLESLGMGCYIGHHFYGCMGYADDVKLLCPSINGLQSMINVCENFADEFDVTFNTKKPCVFVTVLIIMQHGAKCPWMV